jgi:hypothetical protein
LELFQDLRKGSVARQWWRMMEPLLMEKQSSCMYALVK